jgi:hypothetical protein
MSESVCLHCYQTRCLIGVMFTRNQKKVLRRFVDLTRNDTVEILDYMEGGPYQYVQEAMQERMYNLIATESSIAALKAVPTTDHLKVELLQNYLLKEGGKIDEPAYIGFPQHPPNGEKILIFPPEFWKQLFYAHSFRRLRDMTVFWQMYISADFKFFRSEPKDAWRIVTSPSDNRLLASTETGIYQGPIWSIPIVRYQEGMRGLYHWDVNEKSRFCGTFFYFEPDSDSHLLTANLVVAKNKFHACKLIGISAGELYDLYIGARIMTTPQSEAVMKLIFIEFLDEDWIFTGKLRTPGDNNQRMRLREFIRILYNGELEPVDRAVGWKFDFETHYKELYAFEDELDQVLCNGAKKAGIDTVLLTRMTGNLRLVSEVLDVRERQTIFENMWIMQGEETLATLMS